MLTRLGEPRSRPNPHLKLKKYRKSNPRPHDPESVKLTHRLWRIHCKNIFDILFGGSFPVLFCNITFKIITLLFAGPLATQYKKFCWNLDYGMWGSFDSRDIFVQCVGSLLTQRIRNFDSYWFAVDRLIGQMVSLPDYNLEFAAVPLWKFGRKIADLISRL